MTATNMCYNFVGFRYSPVIESKDYFVITAQPHIVYELTAIYGFLNVSEDTLNCISHHPY